MRERVSFFEEDLEAKRVDDTAPLLSFNGCNATIEAVQELQLGCWELCSDRSS
jgi:hypothetical protein